MGLALAPLVAEFLLIVVGVLVALGVDEYRVSREEQIRVEFYRAQLDRELGTISDELAAQIGTFDYAVSSALHLVEGLTSDPLAPSDSLARWLAPIFQGNSWEPELVTLSTMVAAGDLVLFDDPALQNALIRFRDRARSASALRASAYQMRMDGTRAMWGRADFLAWSPWVFGTTTASSPWNWDRLATDVVFRSGIFSIANGLQLHRAALDTFDDELQQLRSALQLATAAAASQR